MVVVVIEVLVVVGTVVVVEVVQELEVAQEDPLLQISPTWPIAQLFPCFDQVVKLVSTLKVCCSRNLPLYVLLQEFTAIFICNDLLVT